MKKLVLFGAGKIGRSFIGQLFARSGYEVVFVDIAEPIIQALNSRKAYQVVIKSSHGDEVLQVENVRGVMSHEVDKVAEEISGCDIAAVSVGQKGLPYVLCHTCGLRPDLDHQIINRILAARWEATPVKLMLGQMFAERSVC